MRMYYTAPDGRETSLDVVEGTCLVLESGGEKKIGRFVGIETIGYGRWKRTAIRARTFAGVEFVGPLFWFRPLLIGEETTGGQA